MASSIILARKVVIFVGVGDVITGFEDGAVILFCDIIGDGKSDGMYDKVRLGVYTLVCFNGDGELV